MPIAYKLLAEGELVSNANVGAGGFVDTWRITYDAGIYTKLALMNAFRVYLQGQTWWEAKDGFPLTEVRLAKLPGSTDKATARVIYGRAGGNGGFYTPLAYSTIIDRRETLSIPVVKRSSVGPTQHVATYFPKPRTVSVYRFNARIEQSQALDVREEIRSLRNKLRLVDGSLFELAGGRVYRMASGEYRGEVEFEQKAAVPAYSVLEIGNDVAIPPLGEHWEYDLDINTPEVLGIDPVSIYGPPMDDNTFAWADFNV